MRQSKVLDSVIAGGWSCTPGFSNELDGDAQVAPLAELYSGDFGFEVNIMQLDVQTEAPQQKLDNAPSEFVQTNEGHHDSSIDCVLRRHDYVGRA